MTRSAHFFDLDDANALFGLLRSVADSFASSPVKRVQDLLFLVFGLTHLREWIAPGYRFRPEQVATTPAQQFYQDIYELREFRILQNLCNRSKHMSASDSIMGMLYRSTISDWPDIDSVPDFDRGFPTAYSIDDKDALEVIHIVIDFYDKHWFQVAAKNE